LLLVPAQISPDTITRNRVRAMLLFMNKYS
jgi:hypothetical protein